MRVALVQTSACKNSCCVKMVGAVACTGCPCEGAVVSDCRIPTVGVGLFSLAGIAAHIGSVGVELAPREEFFPATGEPWVP